MNDLVSREKLQSLEQRHEELIAELDILDSRLEQVLQSILKPSNTAENDEAVA